MRTLFSVAQFAFLFVLMFPLGGEPLKGTYRGEVLPDTAGFSVGLDDLVQLPLTAANRFTKALEIEVTVPRELLPFRSSFAVVIYQNFVAPRGKDSALGERLTKEVLPPNAKFYLQAPLVPKAGLKASVDTAVLKLAQLDKAFPLGLAVVAIADVPAEFTKAQFQVRTRPVNSNLGALNVVTPGLSSEDRKRLKLIVNGAVQPSEGWILLEPGLYGIEASLAGFGDVTTNASVGQAKVTDVTLLMEPQSPTVKFEAPEGSLVVLDGRRLLWNPLTEFPIEPGAHMVQVSVGNTLLSQNFEIPGGGNYLIRINLQLVVEKE
jgi:hypothetical protein